MKNNYQFICIVLLFVFSNAVTAADQYLHSSITLSLKPKECVVLKEGDKCYADVAIKWKANVPSSLCLYRAPDEIKLTCWDTQNEGQFTEKLVMDEPVDYYLATADDSEILAKETLHLFWVHKKSNRPNSTWRLF
ncbi:DUF3019 domain-containing protein [Cellvibrio sp. pealriver]|uniref:DUF3019 domain-containing protein n=1 Tax=Cellvibrio sp. pealriver TaxID=1622269 RepID=UPI00066FFB8F|nr:DUF3019 domain-containing protein [Cellvibrio sp. pealriver]